ncbi:MAG: ComF family protein [Rubrivivax sp.]
MSRPAVGAGHSAICDACVRRYGAERPRCRGCGIGLGAAASACGACLADPPPFERTVCAVDYGFPWNHVITAFKFQGRVELAAALAQRLMTALRRAQAGDDPLLLPERIVPVPLSDQRLRERGYNQAWELARPVSSALGIEADGRLLQRPLETAHQAELNRAARRLNLRGAFMVDPQRRSWLAGRRVALVDDVMTTGATAREAATVLLRAGAAAVQVWALARTD